MPTAMSKTYRNVCLCAAIALLSCALACRRVPAGDRPVVMTSIPPLQALVADIAGDSLDVRCLTGSSTDPETFDPSMVVMCDLYDSRMLLSVGTLPFEQSLTRRLADEAPGISVVNVACDVPLLYGTHDHHGHDVHHGHDHGEADPHVWTSARSLAAMTAPVAEALGRLDPPNAIYYARRADSVRQRLDSLDRAITARLRPYRGDTVMSWHPALAYYARDYGLTQLPLGAEGRENSVGAMRALLDASAGPRVRTLFYQQPSDSLRAADVAHAAGLVPTLVRPMDADYINQLKIITDAIATVR